MLAAMVLVTALRERGCGGARSSIPCPRCGTVGQVLAGAAAVHTCVGLGRARDSAPGSSLV